MVTKFTDLEIWQLSKEVCIKTYRLLASFPKDEKFGIVSQCKNSIVSIAANIAEGFGRYHYNDKIKFYFNSRGSLLETKSHLLISESLGFINDDNRKLFQEILSSLETLGIKLNNFISSSKPKQLIPVNSN